MTRLAVALAILCLSGCSWFSNEARGFHDDADARQNQWLYRVGVVLHYGIETYMSTHGESAPETEKVVASLQAGNYLPNRHLPSNPWLTSKDVWDVAGVSPSAFLPLSSVPALGSVYDEPIAVGTTLGPGQLPGAYPATPQTYGTFVYGATRGGLRYVLYGIGRHGDQAIVRFVATPDGHCCE